MDYLFSKSFHYRIMHKLMLFTPLIMTQLWTSVQAHELTKSSLKLQDFVPIFEKFSGGGPLDPP